MAYASVGIGPSKAAMDFISKEDKQRLYYRTQASSDQSGRRVCSEDERGENFTDVHGMGQRDSKYWAYEPKSAPLVQRSATSSTRDFVKLPLGDNVFNRELAVTYKEGLAAGIDNRLVPFKAKSSYNANFQEKSAKEVRKAKRESAVPVMGLTDTINGSGKFYGSRSHEHDMFGLLDRDLAKPSDVILPKPNLLPIGRSLERVATSSYRKDIDSSGRLAAQHLLKSASDPSLSRRAAEKPAYMTTRRAPHMSPGQ